MHRILLALTLLIVAGAGVAQAQTVTIIQVGNFLAACPAMPSGATDKGLFVSGNAQTPYNYSEYVGVNNDEGGSSSEFVPPASASAQWAQCHFGPGAILAPNDLLPGPGRDFIASDLGGGQCGVIGGEFGDCPGSIIQVDPVAASNGLNSGTLLHSFSLPNGQAQTRTATRRPASCARRKGQSSAGRRKAARARAAQSIA
jgi:hypothetical protein